MKCIQMGLERGVALGRGDEPRAIDHTVGDSTAIVKSLLERSVQVLVQPVNDNAPPSSRNSLPEDAS